MWSIVQYKNIGRRVERVWQPRFPGRSHNSNKRDDTIALRDSHETETTPGESRQERDASAEENTDEQTRNAKVTISLDSDKDPLNPLNWPLLDRAKTMTILCMLVFVQAWAGACVSLANTKASHQYHVSPVAQDLSTAVYLFGISCGCLFVGPLSQTVGRNPVYLAFSFVYIFFVLGTALSRNFGSQIVCRYFTGLSSSAALGINGASVADMFRPVERTLWFPVMAWVNVVPPVLAPIVGGWIVSRNDLNWIWTNWITLIISGVAFLVAFFFLPETHLPTLLEYKAKHIRRITGDNSYVTEQAQSSGIVSEIKKVSMLSFKFSTSEPAVLSLGGFLILLYILLFTFLSGFDYIFKRRYNLTSLEEGACFGSIALGATAFSLTAPALYAWTRRTTGYDYSASVVPEFRLWPAMLTSPLLPISLFWLGWTNYKTISIYSGLGACFCFGIVLNAMYVSIYEYIIDSYGDNAAIALASITMMRYMIAGGMVMAARPMYEGIGVHWTMTLLGCVGVVLMPAPYVLLKYGKKLRTKSPYAITDTGEGEENE